MTLVPFKFKALHSGYPTVNLQREVCFMLGLTVSNILSVAFQACEGMQ